MAAARKPARRSSAHRPQGARSRAKLEKWSAKVTQQSDAVDLEQGVFAKRSAREIAASLKRSAERSHRRKAPTLRSALSMLTFYINRAGKSLSARRRRTLEAAKDELRRLFGTKKANS